MTTQTPTAPASEAGKCKCACSEIINDMPLCGQPYGNPLHDNWCKNVIDGFECGHDAACHTPNRADPGP